MKPVKTILENALDAVLPPRCPVSGEQVVVQGALSPESWAALNFITDPVCEVCGIPMELDLDEPQTCAACSENPPVFHSARAALAYDDGSRDLVLGFKHGDKTQMVVSFIPWLRRVGRDLLEGTDYIVPVPLHRWRLLGRRYNQSALIASALSKASGKICLPEALLRRRATPPQGHLRAGEREKNVSQAFCINPKYANDLVGKTILLIDDVYTTGATVSECARVLIDAEALQVNVLTLARVVKPQRL